ncbi:MAG: tetratricopeptide repeat protein [Thermoplasmata archaeon]
MVRKIVLFGENSAKEDESCQDVPGNYPMVLIEDIYLIHRGSGKLIQRKTWRIESETDPDMVAGMFEAILNFISDSFARTSGRETKFSRFDIKGFTVLLHAGNLVNLAVVLSIEKDFIIPENIFHTMRQIMEKYVEELERDYLNVLSNWDGEIDAVKGTRNLLEELSITLNKTLAPSREKTEISDRIFQEAIFEIVRKADLAMKSRKYSSAISLLDNCISMGYAPPDIVFKKAKALFYCRKYAQALETLKPLEGSMEKIDEYWLLKARLLWKVGRDREALASIEHLLEIMPDHKKAHKLKKEIPKKSGE